MKTSIIILLYFAILTHAYSQALEGFNQAMEDDINVINASMNQYVAMEGSPYLNNKFLPAKFGDSQETKLVRFNVVENVIEVMVNEAKVLKLRQSEPYNIQMIDGSKKKYETHTFLNEKDNLDWTFFELIHSNTHFNLYLKERIKFIEGKKNAGYEEDTPSKFLKVDDIYYLTNFKKEGGELVALPRKKKKFVSFFGKKSKLVQNYMKSEDIDFRSASGLGKILELYFSEHK